MKCGICVSICKFNATKWSNFCDFYSMTS
ncbi:MAG: hypothetical protein LBS15_03415 [Endomicrobium sp.]|nr:hypothetical protein [Endomicrobium sp.]